MPGLPALFWGKWVRLLWQELSSELRTALVTLFRSSLTTITIEALDDFPLSILHAVSPLKRLEISSANLLENNSKLVVLPHSETLILLYLVGRRILLQQAINTAAGSLEQIK